MCTREDIIFRIVYFLYLDSPKPSILYNKWACENADIVAELRCTTDANPAANFTWYKMPPQDGADEQETVPPMLLNEVALPAGYRIVQDMEDSLLLVSYLKLECATMWH